MTGKRKHPWIGKHSSKRPKSSDHCSSKLEVGMVGALVSHDRSREKPCRMDSFRLFNHFADKLYGTEKEEAESQEGSDDCSDIESALSAEVVGIKGKANQKAQHLRRFSTVKSGCNNLIFVRFKEIGPGILMQSIVESLVSDTFFKEHEIPLVKNMLRVHPVEFSCPAYLDSMCKNIPTFLEKKLAELAQTAGKEYTIDYKCRNNSHLSRQSVLDGLVQAMKDSPSGWKYNCRSQSVSVIIDVLKTVCLVSVVKDYYKYKKYNIRELIQKRIPKDAQSEEKEEKKCVEVDKPTAKTSEVDRSTSASFADTTNKSDGSVVEPEGFSTTKPESTVKTCEIKQDAVRPVTVERTGDITVDADNQMC